MRGAQRGSASALEALFRRTGRARTAPRTSSSTTPRLLRTSHRSPSWRRSARSTGSTAGGRSGRGCTGSWSTGRSTGLARAGCARRSSSAKRLGALEQAPPLDGSLLAALGELSPEQRAVDRPPAPARIHARRDRGAARPPARHRQLAAAPGARLTGRRRCEGGARVGPDPGRGGGGGRAWRVVREAYAERVPTPRQRSCGPVAALVGGCRRRRRGGAEPARPRRARRAP